MKFHKLKEFVICDRICNYKDEYVVGLFTKFCIYSRDIRIGY